MNKTEFTDIDKVKPTYNECALCGSSEPLQNSHIIPAFIFRWQKKTGTPMRSAHNPNKRVQDGIKLKMLCRKCEQRFEGSEKKFKECFFTPVTNDDLKPIKHGSWLLYFCVSLSWRVLRFGIDAKEGFSELNPIQIDQAHNALQKWSSFLLGKSANPGEFEQNIVIASQVLAGDEDIPNNINRYLMRQIGLTIAANELCAQVFTKLGPISIFGMIQNDPKITFLTKRIGVQNGLFEPYEAKPMSWALRFFCDEAQNTGRLLLNYQHLRK